MSNLITPLPVRRQVEGMIEENDNQFIEKGKLN
jgi:hypothetical protein